MLAIAIIFMAASISMASMLPKIIEIKKEKENELTLFGIFLLLILIAIIIYKIYPRVVAVYQIQ